MISTPTRPAIVASQRRTPTFSPRNAIDNAVTNSGAMKPVAEASAIGRNRSPETKKKKEEETSTDAPTKDAGGGGGGGGGAAPPPPPGIFPGTMIIANTRNRIH